MKKPAPRSLHAALAALLPALAFAFPPGKDKGDYFYPEPQAWRFEQSYRLSPAPVAADLAGIPAILLGSKVLLGANFFSTNSVNSGMPMMIPACFLRDGKRLHTLAVRQEELDVPGRKG